MKDENTLWNYLAFGVAFIFEAVVTPYYLFEDAADRAQKYTMYKKKRYSY